MNTNVAVIGTQGIPAHYGGFETLAENLVQEKQDEDIRYTVFCSSKDLNTHMPELAGARLEYLPLKSNGMQSILYDILSMLKSVRGYDTLLILGVSGCIFIPILKLLTRAKIVVNIDGLEHRRQKWGRFARWFLWHSEQMAVNHADVIIADNKGIRDYVISMYGKTPELIAYGGDHVKCEVDDDEQLKILNDYGLKSRFYALAVCRIEPENNLEMVLEAFAQTGRQFALIGNFSDKEFPVMLKNKYGHLPNIHLFDACYDQKILFTLHNHARCYVHGHSAGGTNPSLVEAMFFDDCPILAYDVVYNRATTFGKASYFANADELEDLLRNPLPEQKELYELAKQRYSWKTIVNQYEKLIKVK